MDIQRNMMHRVGVHPTQSGFLYDLKSPWNFEKYAFQWIKFSDADFEKT